MLEWEKKDRRTDTHIFPLSHLPPQNHIILSAFDFLPFTYMTPHVPHTVYTMHSKALHYLDLYPTPPISSSFSMLPRLQPHGLPSWSSQRPFITLPQGLCIYHFPILDCSSLNICMTLHLQIAVHMSPHQEAPYCRSLQNRYHHHQ